MWQIYAIMARDLNQERQRKLESQHRAARSIRTQAHRGLIQRLVASRKG